MKEEASQLSICRSEKTMYMPRSEGLNTDTDLYEIIMTDRLH